MTEPDMLSQTGDLSSGKERRAWIELRADEAKAEGMQHGRCSFDEEHNLVLVEFWKERPDEEGEPRFQFAAHPQS